MALRRHVMLYCHGFQPAVWIGNLSFVNAYISNHKADHATFQTIEKPLAPSSILDVETAQFRTFTSDLHARFKSEPCTEGRRPDHIHARPVRIEDE